MKAILVIEMPENCDVCDLSNTAHGYHENCLNHEFFETDIDFYERPSWCPLKPMPEKIDYDRVIYNPKAFDRALARNNLIDEILGEDND